MVRFFRWAIVACGIVVLMASAANAQAIGQIFGKVTDSTGGVLPGVTVTVTGTGLQQPLVFVTTQSGAYTFPSVPIGTYTVSFELSGFKKITHQGVVITSGFSAAIDAKMEIGAVSTEVNVSAAPPVVDTKKTTTGGTFTSDILNNIPTARDPWQVINMAPGIELTGTGGQNYNVGGTNSGQQMTISAYGSSASVQWNLEGGNITDESSNSSSVYFNFDSFEEIQVVTGGGDVSVQSEGVYINLVTKSGSNVFKGTGTLTFENASMQGQNVSQAQFTAGGSNGTGLSGNPIHRIGNYSAEFGGPIQRNRLWFWGAWDTQDINYGDANFFNTSQAGCNPPPSTFAQLSAVQGCLNNDHTQITDYNAKINYQLNAANKFQYLFASDNKHRNSRIGNGNPNANYAIESTYQQYSPGKLPDQQHQITHTLILTDKLVFTNQMTYVHGGFYLDSQDWQRCGSTSYAAAIAGTQTDPTCISNIQDLYNRTTGYENRSNFGTTDTQRPSWEVKTDGNYFLSNVLGGDHALKFGVGWRKNPVLTYTNGSGGGARAEMECPNNSATGCASPLTNTLPAYIAGLVPYEAQLYRPFLSNYNWWTWSSYLQDSYSHGRWRINGGVRQDYQNSQLLGGTVPANTTVPNLLPAYTQGTSNAPFSFDNFSPRVSVTYDVFGNGKTQVHGSFSYYYDTKIVLANGLSNLGSVELVWGPNQNSGACSTTAGAPCWNDANHDGIVQANELIGTPSGPSNFNTATGVLSTTPPIIDPNLQIGRTREGVVGVQHELMSNVAIGADYIYRYYDHGSTTRYLNGYQPGAAGYPLSNLYVGPYTYTDPTTGTTAPYYTICTGCVRPSGIPSITTTNPSYKTYEGEDFTLQKRMSNRWQASASLTLNNTQSFAPNDANPTGFVFSNGFNTDARYIIKALASAQLWWGFNVGANLNWTDGPVRVESINGPGSVYGGLTATGSASTISYSTLAFQPSNTVRYPAVKDLDLNVSRVVSMRGGKDRVTLTLDCFNVFNENTILSYASSNLDSSSYNAITAILPPRIFRVGARIAF